MNLLLTTPLLEDQAVFLKSSLVILYLILAALCISCLIFTFITLRSPIEGNSPKFLMVLLYLVTAFVLISSIVCTNQYKKIYGTPTPSPMQPTTPSTSLETQPTSTEQPDVPTAPTEMPTVPNIPFTAFHTETTDPGNWGIKWDVMQNSTVLDSYQHADEIFFGEAEDYTSVEGIVTFRGNNYRNSAFYGNANIINQTITKKWSSQVGIFNGWSGCGWTGQPLIVRWDEETKAIMNLYADKKAKPDLVEVIYATLDGHIYFYDLEDGSYTRKPINVGMNFKGAGSLDPRGYPLLYVGSGDTAGKAPRMYIISLIEGKIIYEQSGSDIDAYRRWYAFDSAPLIDAETDTMIWPGESGLLYITKLNTVYAKESGIISVEPDNIVKLRYKTNHSRKVGTEASSLIVENYLYYADNGGMFFCVDLKTMELVWTQDTHDDVNATPVFERGENGEGYIYTGTSMEYAKGTSYIHKLDARTGEILWEYTFENVTYNESVSGGILSSPILGKPGTTIEGLIIYCVARTPSSSRGTLVALDTETGELVWSQEMSNYAWSSPTALYTEDGTAYFILCDSRGKVALHEGATGNIIDYVEVDSNIEASPVVFENTVVVGTRGRGVFAFNLE